MLFILFFVYVFPLFFYYVGIWTVPPILATISLAIGIVGWILFNIKIYKSMLIEPAIISKRHENIKYMGKPVTGRVTEKFERSINKHGHKSLEVTIEFENYNGTIVETTLNLEDSKPCEKRFEIGNEIKLRLNHEDTSPPFIIVDSRAEHNKSIGYFWVLFNLGYGIMTFLISYYFLNRGLGWRYLSPWFPWVMTPYFGMLLLGSLGVLSSSGGITKKALNGFKKEEDANKLLLHGKKTVANVSTANQTGMYLNEQPELEFAMSFIDHNKITHHKSFKRYVLLTDLYKAQKGEREIIYLPENTDVFDLL